MYSVCSAWKIVNILIVQHLSYNCHIIECSLKNLVEQLQL